MAILIWRLGLICLTWGMLLPAADSVAYNRLYVFGDSYSDIGEGYLDGNGPTAVAYLAEHLGLTLHPSTDFKKEDSLDFAVSGAQTGRGAGHRVKAALLGFGMQNQVDEFVRRVQAGEISFNAKKTLFFIAGGLNDKQLPSKETVDHLEGEIRNLYGVGGRHFLVALLPTAIPSFSAVGQRLNPELAAIPGQMASELPDLHIGISHWGGYFDEVMRDPARYGIKNTVDACAGRAIFDQDATPCAQPDEHYFYHSGHPSTAVHRLVGEKLYREALDFAGQTPGERSRP